MIPLDRDTIFISALCGKEFEAAVEAEVRKHAEPIIKAAASSLSSRLRKMVETQRDYMRFDGVRVMVALNGEIVADSDKAAP